MNEGYLSFLEVWNQLMYIGVWTSLIVSAIFLLYHLMKLVTIRDLKKKYDYINLNEIKIYWYAALFLDIAVVFFLNSIANDTVAISYIWFFVRLFVGVCLGLIFGFIFNYSLKVYYPFKIEKKLRKLRFQPRKSPKTGKLMKLLSEEEEDVHLDEGMIAEEEVFAIDYDVWIDEETGYTRIDKYTGRFHAERCPNCNYMTLRVNKEELTKSPTVYEGGEILKHFICSYCGHKTKKEFTVAKLREEIADQGTTDQE